MVIPKAGKLGTSCKNNNALPHVWGSALFRIPYSTYFFTTLIFRSSTWRPFTCKS